MKAIHRYLLHRQWTVPVVAAFVLGLLFTPASAQEISDKDITLTVEDEFQNQIGIPAHLIDVETKDGIVTLTGRVDNILVKERTTKVVETIKGVRSVINRIQVEPLVDRSDRQIRKDVKGALFKDPATENYEIDVTVDEGIVTLSGTVDSWQEKQLCEQVAMTVKGLKAVRNNITVEYEAERPDSEIKADIERRLAWDVWVDDALIDVTVQNGEVTLSGTVGSAAEKSCAFLDAFVAGVKTVDTTGLEVAWWMRDKMRRAKKDMVKSDQRIKAAIEDAFRYDPRVFSFNPEVQVEDGVVTLTGIVDNLKARRAAEQDARNTLGVWRVKNYLKVRLLEWPPDTTVAEDVREVLSRNPLIDQYDIRVSVVNGTVYLFGTVDARYEKNLADDLASGVKGVVEVHNHLKIPSRAIEKTDWEIKQDIESELWWSTYVDSDDITVTVEDGVATLTGTVDSWRERGAAADNAYEGGAQEVHNLLKVEYGPVYYQ